MSDTPRQPWPEATDADDAFIALVDRYLSDDATAEDADALNAALREDPRRLALFAALATESEHLRQAHQPTAAPEPALRFARARMKSPAPLRPSTIAWSLAAAILLSAAAVATYIFVITPHEELDDPAPKGPPVATLIETRGGELTTPNDYPVEGKQYTTGRYALSSGSAEFMLTNSVNVKLRGDTRLHMHNDMNVSLGRGSAEFVVPAGATGFTVHLPDASKIVDLGTAFRVAVDDTDAVTVAVTEGKVRVVSPTQTQIVEAGQHAQLVDGRITQAAGRAIALDLVDLLNGGDGTSRRRGLSIDPPRGDAYNVNAHHPLIDGSFLPDGQRGAVTLDSMGHTYEGFRVTDGKVWGPIHTGGPIRDATSGDANTIAGVDYAADGHSLITVVPNRGVTFDLEAIAAAASGIADGAAPTRFTGVAGYGVSTDQKSEQDEDLALGADLLIFVDGQLAFERIGFDAGDGAIDIDIPIPAGARFLTIVTTDGGNTIAYDWVVIGDPTLHIPVPRLSLQSAASRGGNEPSENTNPPHAKETSR